MKVSESSQRQADRLIPIAGNLDDDRLRAELIAKVAHALDRVFVEGMKAKETEDFINRIRKLMASESPQ